MRTFQIIINFFSRFHIQILTVFSRHKRAYMLYFICKINKGGISMVAVEILSKPSNINENAQTAIIENWHGLYRRDSRFLYTEATLIIPKKNTKSNKK